MNNFANLIIQQFVLNLSYDTFKYRILYSMSIVHTFLCNFPKTLYTL